MEKTGYKVEWLDRNCDPKESRFFQFLSEALEELEMELEFCTASESVRIVPLFG